MKLDEAMNTEDAKKWSIAVDEEHDCMIKRQVIQPVLQENVPEGETTITSTWTMKKKANGTYRACINA